jgi:hypothetical protein
MENDGLSVKIRNKLYLDSGTFLFAEKLKSKELFQKRNSDDNNGIVFFPKRDESQTKDLMFTKDILCIDLIMKDC